MNAVRIISIVFGSLLMGALLGLIPFFYARKKGYDTMGLICMLLCMFGSFIAGLFLSVPICLISVIVIAVKKEPTRNADPYYNPYADQYNSQAPNQYMNQNPNQYTNTYADPGQNSNQYTNTYADPNQDPNQHTNTYADPGQNPNQYTNSYTDPNQYANQYYSNGRQAWESENGQQNSNTDFSNIYCPACGKQLRSGTAYCTNCGRKM